MIKIIQGKLEEELPKIPNNSIHYVFVDPPYNIGYTYKTYKDTMVNADYFKWTESWFKMAIQKLVSNGVIQIMTHNKHLNNTINIGKKYSKFYEITFWKASKQPNNSKTFQNFSQPIITFVKGDNTIGYNPRVDNKQYYTDSNTFYTNVPKIERILYQNTSRIDNSLILDKVANNLIFDKEITEDDITLALHALSRNIKAIDNWDSFVLNAQDFFSGPGILQHIFNEFFVRFSFIENKNNKPFEFYNNQRGHFSDIDRVYSGSFSKKEAIKEGVVKVHSCQMPIELALRGIKRFTDPNDTVMDFFVGSGTTTIAAEILKRNSIGIDIDTEYCVTAKQRLNNIESEIEKLSFHPFKIKPFKEDIPGINITKATIDESIYFIDPDRDTDANISYEYPYLYHINSPETKNIHDAPEGVNIFLINRWGDFGNIANYGLTPIRFGLFYNKHQHLYFAHCIKGVDKKDRIWNNIYFPRIINWKHKRETLKAEGVRPSEVVFVPTFNAYTCQNIRDDWKMRLRAHYVALMRYYTLNSTDINKDLVLHLINKIYEPLLTQGQLLRSIHFLLGHIAGEL